MLNQVSVFLATCEIKHEIVENTQKNPHWVRTQNVFANVYSVDSEQ